MRLAFFFVKIRMDFSHKITSENRLAYLTGSWESNKKLALSLKWDFIERKKTRYAINSGKKLSHDGKNEFKNVTTSRVEKFSRLGNLRDNFTDKDGGSPSSSSENPSEIMCEMSAMLALFILSYPCILCPLRFACWRLGLEGSAWHAQLGRQLSLRRQLRYHRQGNPWRMTLGPFLFPTFFRYWILFTQQANS